MPTDEIFNDEYMNEMMMNPDLYGLENKEEIHEKHMEDEQGQE